MNRPLTLKNITIKNRFAIPPMVCFQWPDEDGFVTEKNIAHYRDLAKGGAGLIIVEATAITKRAKLHESELGIWEDGHIAGLKKITDEIHAYGAKAFIQLVHAGGNGIDMEADAPSTMPYSDGIRGIEMSRDRIEEVKNDFVRAAVRAKAAGFDGVEIHGCHSYLISCFCSSITNVRTDEYGKDRSLFAREVLQAVRGACGEDYIVGIRLAAFEPTLEDGIRNAVALSPYTDFLDISYGVRCEPCKPEGFPCSAAVYGAKCIKERLPEMPVFGVDHINSKEDVENALNTGIDMADIGRAALVDPAFPNHVLNNEPAGACLHCDHYCRWNHDNMRRSDLQCPGAVKFHRSAK